MNWKILTTTLIGAESSFSLEKRIFHMAVLSSCVITFAYLVEAIILSFSLELVWFILISLGVFIVLYVSSRRTVYITWPVWIYLIINCFIVVYDWLYTGGVSGVSRPIAISLIFLIPFILKKETLYIGYVIYLIFFLAWVVLTLFFWRQVPIQSPSFYLFLMSIFEITILVVFLGIIAYITVDSYRKERMAVLTLNEKLIKSNTEIDIRNKVLSQLGESRNQFFKIIAHDLRGPIGAIHGVNEILLTDFSNMKKNELKEILRSLTESSRNTYRLLDNLLNWSKAAGGDMKVENTDINISSLAQEVIELMLPMYAVKKVALQMNIDSVVIFSDSNIIRTVLRNLLSNALKFSNPGTLVQVNGYTENSKVYIEVVDQGIGMDESTVNNLFKIDKVKSRCGTNEEKGSGLGLILCHELLDKIESSIHVSSVLNQGSTFKVELSGRNKSYQNTG